MDGALISDETVGALLREMGIDGTPLSPWGWHKLSLEVKSCMHQLFSRTGSCGAPQGGQHQKQLTDFGRIPMSSERRSLWDVRIWELLTLPSLWAKSSSCCVFRSVLHLAWVASQKITPKEISRKPSWSFSLTQFRVRIRVLSSVCPPSPSHRSFLLESGHYIIPAGQIEPTCSCLQRLKPHSFLRFLYLVELENDMDKPERWLESFWKEVSGKRGMAGWEWWQCLKAYNATLCWKAG